MATLKVQSNGNAPSNAKVGDHIVTAGGTYEVLDGSKYSGMSADQLASAGVGYNPSSGLYSKKLSDVSTNVGTAQSTTPQLSLRTPDTARQWANQQNQKVSADLDSAFYQNRQDAYNTYMDSITRQNQQANNVNQAYLDNVTKLYDDTYANNQAALQRAASRGLMSSGLGNAMQVSALADASKQNAQYRAQRNRDLNNIEAEMNNLTNQYNVNLDTLAKKLRSDKTSALSQNEIAFLEAVMEIEEYNANAENAALTTQQQQAYEAEQAMLDREYKASEAEKDRELQRLLLQMQIDAGSFSGGYGYGGRGGYSRYGGYGGYRNYGSGSSSSDSSSGFDFSSKSAENAYNSAVYLNQLTPGGFLSPDKQFINALAMSGASAGEIKAATTAARLNAISIGNGGGTVQMQSATDKAKTGSSSSSSSGSSGKRYVTSSATGRSNAKTSTTKPKKTSTSATGRRNASTRTNKNSVTGRNAL